MGKPIQILIVEDEMIIAANLSLQLTDLGYDVAGIIPRAEEALVRINLNPPDILLLDIDVVAENVFTTDMPEFLKQSAYRSEIYKKRFPTGSWLGVKALALPEFMVEIELEVHKPHQ